MKWAVIIHAVVILILLLFALAPVISVAIAGQIASSNNCDLDEGSIHPCIVNGNDIGGTLYTMGMMGWFMLATIPLGAAAIAIYVIGVAAFYLIRWIIRRRRASQAAEQTGV